MRYMDLLRASPLAAGFFRTDRYTGPYLLVRIDGIFGAGNDLIDSMGQFHVALTFARMPTSGLVAVFVSSELLKDVSTRGFLEQIYGLDDENTRRDLSDAMHKDALDVVLAGDSGYKYDMVIPLNDACKAALVSEWNSIISYHRGIRIPNFRAAGQRLFELFPENTSPILPN
jgi:hypothetical protein